MSTLDERKPDPQASPVEILVEALGILQTRDGFEVPPELVEERARNAIAALQSSHAIVRIGPARFGEALAHLDAASTIIVQLEASLSAPAKGGV